MDVVCCLLSLYALKRLSIRLSIVDRRLSPRSPRCQHTCRKHAVGSNTVSAMRNQSKSKPPPPDCSLALAMDLTRIGHALLSLGLGRLGLSHVITQKISFVDSSSRKKRICESGGQKKRNKKKKVFFFSPFALVTMPTTTRPGGITSAAEKPSSNTKFPGRAAARRRRESEKRKKRAGSLRRTTRKELLLARAQSGAIDSVVIVAPLQERGVRREARLRSTAARHCDAVLASCSTGGAPLLSGTTAPVCRSNQSAEASCADACRRNACHSHSVKLKSSSGDGSASACARSRLTPRESSGADALDMRDAAAANFEIEV
jgi:hypothetical protein